jgi:hypothetical protein
MENLKELIAFLDRYKVRQIDVLTNPTAGRKKEESRYFECYVGLREGRWATEAEMAEHFNYPEKSKAYARFKNEVKKRLLNSVLFIDTSLPEFSDYSRAAVALIQQWAVAKTLLIRGISPLFIEVAQKALESAIHHERLETIVEITTALRERLALFPQYSRDYRRTVSIFEQYYAAYQAEIEVGLAYESLVHRMALKKSLPDDLAAEAQKLAETLSDRPRLFPYLTIQYKYCLIAIYAANLARDWTKAIEHAESTLALFEQKPFELKMFRLALIHQIGGCCVVLGNHAAADLRLSAALPLALEGSPNWFKTRELILINALYGDDYGPAWRMLKSTLTHSRFPLIPAFDQESWRLYQGYLYFIVKLGKLDVSPREKGEVEKFRLSSWLNDLPLHSLDKRGANIPLLILQALFLLHADRLDEFENRIEAMRKYRQRNLDGESEHLRTDAFIRLLELTLKHHYEPSAIARVAPPLLERMGGESVDLLNGRYEIEVVPYERQWQWVTELLARVYQGV